MKVFRFRDEEAKWAVIALISWLTCIGNLQPWPRHNTLHSDCRVCQYDPPKSRSLGYFRSI